MPWWASICLGSWGHKGYSFSEIFKYLAVDLDGIFGTTISVSASTIFMFVMFGAFLEASAAHLYHDLALSVTGKLRCGPALAAVVASPSWDASTVRRGQCGGYGHLYHSSDEVQGL